MKKVNRTMTWPRSPSRGRAAPAWTGAAPGSCGGGLDALGAGERAAEGGAAGAHEGAAGARSDAEHQRHSIRIRTVDAIGIRLPKASGQIMWYDVVDPDDHRVARRPQGAGARVPGRRRRGIRALTGGRDRHVGVVQARRHRADPGLDGCGVARRGDAVPSALASGVDDGEVRVQPHAEVDHARDEQQEQRHDQREFDQRLAASSAAGAPDTGQARSAASSPLPAPSLRRRAINRVPISFNPSEFRLGCPPVGPTPSPVSASFGSVVIGANGTSVLRPSVPGRTARALPERGPMTPIRACSVPPTTGTAARRRSGVSQSGTPPCVGPCTPFGLCGTSATILRFRRASRDARTDLRRGSHGAMPKLPKLPRPAPIARHRLRSKRLVTQAMGDEVFDRAAGPRVPVPVRAVPVRDLPGGAGRLRRRLARPRRSDRARSSARVGDNLPPDIAAQLSPQFQAVLGDTRPGPPDASARSRALWAATGGIGALQKSLNAAYDVPETRDFFAKTGVAAGSRSSAAPGILVAFVTIVGGSLLTQEAVADAGRPGGHVEHDLAAPLAVVLVLVALAVAVLFRFAPNVAVPFRWPMVGGLCSRRLGRGDRAVRAVRRELRQLLEHVRGAGRRRRADAVVLPDGRDAAARRGRADGAAGQGPRARAIAARQRETKGVGAGRGADRARGARRRARPRSRSRHGPRSCSSRPRAGASLRRRRCSRSCSCAPASSRARWPGW